MIPLWYSLAGNVYYETYHSSEDVSNRVRQLLRIDGLTFMETFDIVSGFRWRHI